jgi:hypothetical protein
MSEQNESFLKKSFGGTSRSERDERIRQYIVHQLKGGAKFSEVVRDEYVLRYASPDEVDELVRNDPKLAQLQREALTQEFESDELKPEHPTAAARGQASEEPQRQSGATAADKGKETGRIAGR